MTDCKRLRHCWVNWLSMKTPDGRLLGVNADIPASVDLTCVVPERSRLFDEARRFVRNTVEPFSTVSGLGERRLDNDLGTIIAPLAREVRAWKTQAGK